MKEYIYATLRQRPELKNMAAEWFHCKWGVPQEAYLECMEAYLNNETEYGWYLCYLLTIQIFTKDMVGISCVWFKEMMNLKCQECIFTDKFRDFQKRKSFIGCQRIG